MVVRTRTESVVAHSRRPVDVRPAVPRRWWHGKLWLYGTVEKVLRKFLRFGSVLFFVFLATFRETEWSRMFFPEAGGKGRQKPVSLRKWKRHGQWVFHMGYLKNDACSKKWVEYFNVRHLFNYCNVPRCSVTFWTHPEIIPVGQFFRQWIKSINQA